MMNETRTTLSSSDSREQRRQIVEDALPPSKDHPRISIFGSVDFYDPNSPALCDAIGTALGKNYPEACILTGANADAQERVARAFWKQVGSSARIFHLAPRDSLDFCLWDFGIKLEAGLESSERRRILGTLCTVCISVEGGPGTADEMRIAVGADKTLIPTVRSGGASSGMFDAPTVARPRFVDEVTWALLHDKEASVEDTANAVVSIVRAALKSQDRQNRESRPTYCSIEAMERTIVNALDITYTKRPKLPEAGPAYVEPILGSAHRVFEGQEHASELNDRLGDIYLGPESAASSWDELEEAGIGAILNCTNSSPCHFQGKIKYCSVAVNDECGADILAFLDGATTFLHAFISKGVNVLVHCQMGISRSSTVVIAYLIRFFDMTRDEAYLHVKSRRPRASPNPGFWETLHDWEKKCREAQLVENGTALLRTQADSAWAKQSNALYATCRETPEVLLDHRLNSCLLDIADETTQEKVLNVCLDYLWGRGLLDIDLDWLRYVSETIDSKKQDNKLRSAASTVRDILGDEESEFWSIWAGEVYEAQIQKVKAKITVTER